MNWPETLLNKIVDADNLHISPMREDGVTYGTPTWIWCVSVDGGLYVRAYNGNQSRWYQAAIARESGQIIEKGVVRKVTFVPIGSDDVNDRIDDAYRAKYPSSKYLGAMIGQRARGATIQILPGE